MEGIKRVKILEFEDDQKFISCTYEHASETTNSEENLMTLAFAHAGRLTKYGA